MKEKIEEFMNAPGIAPETIPDIDLYMDQILVFLDEKLKVYERGENEKVMTKTMVNNYVKAKVIKRPHRKKYSKGQVEHLIMLYRLKSVLSLKDIQKIFGLMENQFESVYGLFREIEKKHLESLSRRYEKKPGEGRPDQTAIEIIELAVEADLKKRLAEKLLDGLEVDGIRRK
ncbi:MAG: hypothetical protein C0604_00795 [Clostridiales bacterium]|nr:MAG: hypothetical protein C0604_00795 [Clostridiales bacterium]